MSYEFSKEIFVKVSDPILPLVTSFMILSNFKIILPEFCSTQKETVEWISAAHEKSGSGLSRVVSRYVAKPDRVGHRYHSLLDFTHQNWDEMSIFNLNENIRGASSSRRMQLFAKITNNSLENFYREDNSPPEEIIHVTCTGYVSPSAVQMLVSKKNWGETTKVTHAYHMGCYASVPAIRMALHPKKGIDIVHTELCSLHFNPASHNVDQLVVQGLFADGLVRYSAFSKNEFETLKQPGLEVLEIREEIVPNTSSEMTWEISDFNMEMKLSRNISKIIGNNIREFLTRLCGDDLPRILKNGIFAIHPGGPLIIDEMQKILELQKFQIQASEKILFERGNMSSATLPHIWNEILNDSNVSTGCDIVSLAFGPGLTIAGAHLKKVN